MIEVAAVAGIVCDDDGGNVALLLALMAMGAVAYLWFVGVVRSRLGACESRMVGTVFLGASVLLTRLVLVAASALAAPSLLVDVSGQAPDPGAAQLFRALATVELGVVAAGSRLWSCSRPRRSASAPVPFPGGSWSSHI